MTIETMIRSIVREEIAALLAEPRRTFPEQTRVVPRYGHVRAFLEGMGPAGPLPAADVYRAFLAWQAAGPPTTRVSIQRFGREVRRAPDLMGWKVTSTGTVYTRRGAPTLDVAPGQPVGG